ncbi:MAG: hypothetical protein EOO12_02060 [Chitinophagaceae bacterium]|nr:MAG: hypothetical protein EOO12_02060 [Chitinophagaceae bacterium]
MHTEQELTLPAQPAYSLDYWANEAARMLIQDQRTRQDVIEHLVNGGVAEDEATDIVESLAGAISDAKRARAKKDMLYGGLWCAGGTILTVAHIGYIFWGAIIFGGIQLVKGVVNYND